MARRHWTAGIALVGFAAGLWLALAPYPHRLSIGRMDVAGRCTSPIGAAFARTPDDPFYDLGPGERLPVQLCIRSARRRLANGTALSLLGGAVFVAGRTTWRRQPDGV